jgi:hypothetical protein
MIRTIVPRLIRGIVCFAGATLSYAEVIVPQQALLACHSVNGLTWITVLLAGLVPLLLRQRPMVANVMRIVKALAICASQQRKKLMKIAK